LDYREILLQLSDKDASNITSSFLQLYNIIRTLRGPDGCPWDRKQTAKSLGPNLLEEVYEMIDAVENEDHENITEELGDIFLVTTMISYIFEQEKSLKLEDIFDGISEKLVRRHPHVFGDIVKENADEVVELWDHIKKNVEKKNVRMESILDSIPRTMPPLERAYKIQKKASKAGFDWDSVNDVIEKLHEELNELKDAVFSDTKSKNEQHIEEEIGDVIFSIINISRFLKIDPALALHRTNGKFIERFHYIERKMAESNLELKKENFNIMDRLWEEKKSKDRDV